MRGKVSSHKQTHCTSQFKPCCKSHMWPKLRAMTLLRFTPLHPKRCIIFIGEHHARYCQIKTAHNARKRHFCSFAHYASASTAMYSVCSGTFLSSFRGKKKKDVLKCGTFPTDSFTLQSQQLYSPLLVRHTQCFSTHKHLSEATSKHT